MRIVLKGRCISKGKGEGEALVSREPISFVGGVDPDTGRVVERGHELEGEVIKGKVLIFPHGKGSTAGSWIVYAVSKRGTAPSAIINREAEPIVATGAVIGNIPMLDRVDPDPFSVIETGDFVRVDADNGIIEVEKKG